MIKTLEIWNLESHKHSRFEFDNALNLLCGPSDSGKSSALRALCLVAYNRWDEAMIRVGAKSTRVLATTERGSVEVERGPNIHKWIVKWVEDGEPQEEMFKNIGRGKVPDKAMWVLGMPKVVVAGMESLPNVMCQMDKPFLLSEFEGKSCSPSTVAQVVDELSGLIGLDGLMRDINLDLTRAKRKSTEAASNLKDLLVKKAGARDPKVLVKRAADARALLDASKQANRRLVLVRETQTGITSVLREMGLLSGQETSLDLDACTKILNEVAEENKRLTQVRLMIGKLERTTTGLDDTTSSLAELFGTDKAAGVLRECQSLMERLLSVRAMNTNMSDVLANLSATGDALEKSSRRVALIQTQLRTMMKDNCPLCGVPLSGSAVIAQALENDDGLQ